MADRPDHDLATELERSQNSYIAKMSDGHNSIIVRSKDDELAECYRLMGAAAARLRQLTDDNERLRELAGFLIDACATHRIDVPINSSLLDLAADIAGGGVAAAVGDSEEGRDEQ